MSCRPFRYRRRLTDWRHTRIRLVTILSNGSLDDRERASIDGASVSSLGGDNLYQYADNPVSSTAPLIWLGYRGISSNLRTRLQVRYENMAARVIT